jgi:hypothetical protein
MSDILSRIRRSGETLLSLFKPKSPEDKEHEDRIYRTIEHVVDQVDPRLRAVSGYRRRLFPVVEATVAHAEKLAAQVPGPLIIDRQTWVADPRVNVLFGSGDRLRRVLTHPEVRQYVKEHPLGGDCFAIMASLPDVRNQLGMELAGEGVQRDVRQTTVSFSEQELAHVADSEAEVRRRTADGAHEMLVGIAVQEILERESRITELEDRLRIVRIKLRAAEAGGWGGGAVIVDGSASYQKEKGKLESRVAELERELAEARSGMEGLDDYLDRLIEQLDEPESHLSLEPVSVRIDRMNIVRESGTDADSTELSFQRVHRSGKPARVVHLISFSRSELLEDEERLQGLKNYMV